MLKLREDKRRALIEHAANKLLDVSAGSDVVITLRGYFQLACCCPRHVNAAVGCLVDVSSLLTRRFMHPYYLMKDLLEPIFQKSGHKEVFEELRPDVFGSAYSVFDNRRCKIRLIWDGKDGWGYAQTFNQDAREKWEEWKDIPCFLTEGDLESVPQNQEKIEEFCVAVEKIVA